jgi:hypothetical protein
MAHHRRVIIMHRRPHLKVDMVGMEEGEGVMQVMAREVDIILMDRKPLLGDIEACLSSLAWFCGLCGGGALGREN